MSKTNGEIAYEAYWNKREIQSLAIEGFAGWDDLSLDQRDAWEAVGSAISLRDHVRDEKVEYLYDAVNRLESWFEEQKPRIDPVLTQATEMIAKLYESPLLRMLGVKKETKK